jgi:hypothetical protein
LPDYDKLPHQKATSLNVGCIVYGLLQQGEATKRLKVLEKVTSRLAVLLGREATSAFIIVRNKHEDS